MVFAVYRLKTKEKISWIGLKYRSYIIDISCSDSLSIRAAKSKTKIAFTGNCIVSAVSILSKIQKPTFFPRFLSTFRGYITGAIFMYLYLLDWRVETFLDSFWHTDDAKKLFSLKSHMFHNTVMQMGFDSVFVRNRASPYFVPCFMFVPPLPRVFLCPMYRQRRWRERTWRKTWIYGGTNKFQYVVSVLKMLVKYRDC